MYRNLIIDTNEFYKRAFEVTCRLNPTLTSNIIINKTIYLTTQMILNCKKKFLQENGLVWVLADNPTSKLTIRKALDENYKNNRLRESDGYYRGIDYLLILLQNYSTQFNTIRIQKLEADDLVPEILSMCLENSLLCSADMDWARCMSPSVDWYNHDVVYTQETFKKKYKFFPNERTVTLYKSLLGDKVDNIPSITGINEQTTLNIIDNFQDVYELLASIKKNTEKAFTLSNYTKQVLLKNESRLITNHNLVYFCQVSSTEINQALIKGSFNQKALAILYKSLDFPSNFDSRIEDSKVSFGDIFSNFDEVGRK